MQDKLTKKILIVDEFSASRKILIDNLEQLGFENVDEACDGFSALISLKTRLFDLIIIAYKMKKVSGLELLLQIRCDPNLRGIPVLMVLDDGTEEGIVEAFKAGLNDYVNNPFKVNILSEKINKIFEYS